LRFLDSLRLPQILGCSILKLHAQRGVLGRGSTNPFVSVVILRSPRRPKDLRLLFSPFTHHKKWVPQDRGPRGHRGPREAQLLLGVGTGLCPWGGDPASETWDSTNPRPPFLSSLRERGSEPCVESATADGNPGNTTRPQESRKQRSAQRANLAGPIKVSNPARKPWPHQTRRKALARCAAIPHQRLTAALDSTRSPV
jgi:hypothetical protein